MSKWTLCLLLTVILTVFSVSGVFAEEVAEDLQLNTLTMEETVAASSSEPAASTEPTTEEIIPADYPALTVNAISNFFPNATAEYCSTKKQVEVTYSLRCSKNMMNVQWELYYDPDILTPSQELNTPASICPAIGDKASVVFREGEIIYSSSSIRLYDFSTTETPFAKLIFDVNELDPEEANITKVDLTVDVLCASELAPKTKRSDANRELFLISNFGLNQDGIDSVRLSRNTLLTPSNFVQATPDEPEDTSAVTTAPTAATDASMTRTPSTTVPHPNDSDKDRKEPEKRDLGPVSTGSAGFALISLAALIVATSALFVMRKKEILYN